MERVGDGIGLGAKKKEETGMKNRRLERVPKACELHENSGSQGTGKMQQLCGQMRVLEQAEERDPQPASGSHTQAGHTMGLEDLASLLFCLLQSLHVLSLDPHCPRRG